MSQTSIAAYLTTGVLSLLLQSCASFRQTPEEVLSREPGERFLGHATPVVQEAKFHWEYAWLSEAAYAKSVESINQGATSASAAKAGTAEQQAAGCQNTEDALDAAGWEPWKNFPSQETRGRYDDSHLRVEVWEKRKTPDGPIVAVAFGGTVATSGKDWKSNLRWFIPKHDDEYTELVKDFVPEFSKELSRRLGDPAYEYLKRVKVVATGHSLGGGLAQQFAYAWPDTVSTVKVAEVYAFDPSPVTGYYSVPVKTREENSKGLKIVRIYERGEILASVRSFTSFIYPPSVMDPAVREVRYSFFYSPNSIVSHSMGKLACSLDLASGHPNVARSEARK
ncbi:lipase family protein [Cupriavidus sp. 8B]